MTPSLSDWQDLHATIKPYADMRISIHFGGDASIADPNSPRRQSTSGRYVVWVGNKYARSDKSLTHAARQAINQLGGNAC